MLIGLSQNNNNNNNNNNTNYNACKDSIHDGPKTVLGSHVKGPNNIICRAWV